MKTLTSIFLSCLSICLFSTTMKASGTATMPVENPFMGMWGMDVEGGGVGWLNVHGEKGLLEGELLWIGGSVLPVSDIYMANENTLVATRTMEVKRKNEDGSDERTYLRTWTLRVVKEGEKISGTMIGPDWGAPGEKIYRFTGKRMPPVGPAPDLTKVKFGKPIALFNGKDLTGWYPIDKEKANGFKVMDGTLQNDPVQPKDGSHISYGNLRTAQEFMDFNLSLEVNVPKGNNSGVYLRGLYEVQVVDSYGAAADSHNMGALYSRITPSATVERPGGEWQKLDITLVDRHVTVILNGTTIIDNQPVHGPTGGAISSDVFGPGPIYLQGDHGNVSYRNITLKPVL